MQNPRRILIVEDEAIIAMSLEMELQKAEYHVCRIASTGKDAIVYAEQENPDIILMDIGLSGDMGGFEAARQIRAHHDMPIIFMTGYQENAVSEQAAAIDKTALFHKPLNIRKISAIIDSFEDRVL